ncbi:MAG: DUF6279 family lipoprotein [Halieaceae bacterium]|nr:DUF6279 family lipoprotein [Halieaceae bacterium]
MLLVLLLAGCSSTTFFYNRLDFLVPWYLGRYVDLDDDQGDWLDERLEPLLVWHRGEELPRYDALLRLIEADLDSELTLEGVKQRTRDLEEAWYRTRDPGLDVLLELGARLSDAQLGGFIDELRKRQEKYERKYLDRDDGEFRDDTHDSLREMLEDYLGRLAGDQVDRVALTAAALRRSDATWLRERERWIDTMERLLQREVGWQDAIRRTILGWEAQLDADTLALYQHNAELVQQLIVDVTNARSERQDRRLRRRIDAYRDDIAALLPEDHMAAAARR